MWKQIHDKYFLSFATKCQVYEIFITDFISMWTAKYGEKDFTDQLKNSNEGLLLENEKDYIESGVCLLNTDFDKLKNTRIEENGEHLLLFMKVLTEYPFRLECKLSKCSNEYFFEKITQPLLKTISELKSSQDELIQLLAKKDKEIKAYKRELDNRKIIFPHEVTKEFNEVEHRKNFGSSNIPTCILKKFSQSTLIQKPPSIASIKQEPASTRQGSHSIKQEPVNIKQVSPSIKQEPASVKQLSPSIKQEPVSTKQESPRLKQEPTSIKQEPDSIKPEPDTAPQSNNINEEVNIKLEPNTPVFDDHTEPLVAQSPNRKQEVTKPESSQRNNDRRKRLKLSY